MEWLFRQMPKNEVERDVTQRGQFDTDDARIEATLIREAHQNSLDARVKGENGPVRTRITLFQPSGKEEYFETLFSGLVPHLEASDIDLSNIDFRKPTFLVIEDFGTTGLTGKWDAWDTTPFTDFWRREGRSHKSGTSNGRWGLGKLVFSSASKIRTFFGLTIRHDDPDQPLLMGEAVLTTHPLGDKKFVPYGFFANEDPDLLQLPETNLSDIGNFCAASGITRTSQPGFSVAIPFPLEQLAPESLIEGVLKNYFFPILTSQLEVEVMGELINCATFEAVAAKMANSDLSSELISFIRKVDEAQAKEPDVKLGNDWAKDMEASIGAEKLTALRESFAKSGGIVHARAPISLQQKDGTIRNSHFDLFLMKGTEGAKGESLYIRSTITVPNESRYFNAAETFGALHAKDDAITSFLGDAENPAHTQWNGSAEKLKDRWKAGASRLSQIRGSLRALYKALGQLEEFTEPDALIDFFSVEDLEAGKKRGPKQIVVKPPMPRPSDHEKGLQNRGKEGWLHRSSGRRSHTGSASADPKGKGCV